VPETYVICMEEMATCKRLKYAHENGCACTSAAEYGLLEVLKYHAHENGWQLDQSTCSMAAKNGHMKVLKHAHENGCPWDKDTHPWAAGYGHWEVFTYAHENKCQWDHGTGAMAAENGHMEALKSAHDNGCRWDHSTCIGLLRVVT
jgi:hypothetical protein